MTTLDLPNWNLIKAAVPITNFIGSYIRIPSFSFSDIDGNIPPYARCQFNYKASKPFFVKNFIAPSGRGFLLCIRYRSGNTVYRYKLWDEPNCDITAPLYRNQIIKPNFVIEVFTTRGSGNSIILSEDLLLPITLKKPLTDINSSDYQEGGEPYSINILTNVQQDIPSEYVAYEWDAADAVIGETGYVRWIPAKSGSNRLVSESYGGEIVFNSSDVYFNNRPSVTLQAGSRFISDRVVYTLEDYGGIMIAAMGQPIENSDKIVNSHIGYVKYDSWGLDFTWHDKRTGGLRLLGEDSGIDLGYACIMAFGVFENTKAQCGIMAYNGNIVDYNMGDIDYKTTEYPLIIRMYTTSMNIASIVAVKKSAKMKDVMAYMGSKYLGIKKLPLIFPEGIEWLDNI